MYPANAASRVDEGTDLSLARIDGQDEMFIFPLREYLETNGCRVISGSQSSHVVEYHIVAGSLEFVKSIFETSIQLSIRRLGIVIHSSFDDAKKLTSDKTKIVVVDPVQLLEQDVIEIFSFFFAGNSEALDKRRNIHVPSEHEKALEKSDAKPHEQGSTSEQTQDEYAYKNPPEEDERRIGSLIKDVFGTEEKERRKKEKEKKKTVWKKKGRKGIAFLFLCFLLVLLPPLWYAGSVGATATALVFAGKEFKSGNLELGQRYDTVATYWLHQSEVAFDVTKVGLHVVGADHTVRGQERLLSFLKDVSTIYNEAQLLIVTGRQAAAQLLGQNGNSETSPAALMEKLRLSVVSVHGSLGLAQAQLSMMLEEASFPFVIPVIAAKGREVASVLRDARSQFGRIDQFLALYPRISGFEKPATYLVLLQNSNELRPTGGFIGSLAKITLDQGRLLDIAIQDVYAVDGQLKGHVPPPAPIAELMGQEHWYLRDSNWDPDFKISGQQGAWFYEKETGEVVDGVIAVNLPFVVELLKVTGPIVLADYNDRITAENFFGKSIYYTQTDFFPGSTQKSDFLGTLARTLISRLTTDTTLSPADVFGAFALGLQRKDILFYFRTAELEQLTEHYQWAGRVIPESDCRPGGVNFCLFDPLVFSEANVSVSKVNYFVSRHATREIAIDPQGFLTETVTVEIQNQASGEERGVSGNYLTYVRFFMPQDVTSQDIVIDGVPIPSRKAGDTKPQPPYIERVEAPDGFVGLGAAIDVPTGAKRQVRISYKRTTPLPVSDDREGRLELSYTKQPGVSDMPLITRISYPAAWEADDESEIFGLGRFGGLIAKEGQFEYNNTVSADQFVRVRFKL